MYWIYTPRKTENLASFEAPDPWHAGQPTSFTLDRCFDGRYVPDYSAFDDQSIPHRYAVKSALDGEHRALPDSLAGLWLEKRVAADRLPALLNALEPELQRSDYFRLMTLNRLQRGIRIYGMTVGGAIVGAIVALGGVSFLVSPSMGLRVAGGVMLAAGVLLLVLPGRVVRGWKRRRAQQTVRVLEELARAK